jgi:hypothetical protein
MWAAHPFIRAGDPAHHHCLQSGVVPEHPLVLLRFGVADVMDPRQDRATPAPRVLGCISQGMYTSSQRTTWEPVSSAHPATLTF